MLFFAAFRPAPTMYLWGHELTHAMFAWLSGGGADGLRVAAHGGSIELTKKNAWILLSPYFLPFYLFLLMLVFVPVFVAVSLAAPSAAPLLRGGVALLSGIAWGVHFCWTLNALLQRQSDMEEYGFFFSANLVLLLNLLSLCILFWAISPMRLAQAAALAGVKLLSTLSLMAEAARFIFFG